MAILVDTQIRNNLAVSGSINVLLDISASTITATTFEGSFLGDITGNVTGNVTGSVLGNVAGNVTGSLFGTASWARSASFATTVASGSYLMSIKASAPFTAAASSTYYFGAQSYTNYTDAAADNYKSFDSVSIEAPQAGTIRRAFIKYYCQIPADTAEPVTASIMSGSIVCGSGSFVPTASVSICRILVFQTASIRAPGHPIALRLETPAWASQVPTSNNLDCEIFVS